jgi:hypothetical protein
MPEQTQPKPQNQETALTVPPQGGTLAGPTEINWADDAGDGSTVGRDLDRRLLLIPSIIVLQSDTPFCKKTSSEYIPGCVDGNFFNLSTHESYEGQKTGIQIVPCICCSDFEERTPPAKEGDRGELLAIHSEKSDVIRASGWRDKKLVTPDGNILHERGNMYCLLLGKDQTEFAPVLFRFRSNNLKVFKQLITQISNWLQPHNGKKIKPPCYAGIYRLVTIPDHNDKFSWWGLKLVSTDLGGGRVSFQTLVTNPVLYDTAKAFRASISAGEAVAAEDGSKEEQDKAVNLDGVPF